MQHFSRTELEAEAQFYQIQGIIDELKPKTIGNFEESEILSNEEHRSTLKSWRLPVPDGKWRLLFRASRDGFAGETFHYKCDHKGPTVTIVKSGNNIFGGFTEISWDSKFTIHVFVLQFALGGRRVLPRMDYMGMGYLFCSSGI